MAIQLGSAYGKVSLDVGGLLKAVKQGKEGLFTLASAGEQIGGALKNVGAKLTIGLTLPIVALGAASIKAASDFEETKNKAIVVFDEMADNVVSNANRSASALGISKTQYLDYASSIGAALKAGGLGIKESTELSEQAVKHFADLASFHNARVEDVAAAWQSAIRGQYEPIQRFFPFITDSYLKTYGIANGLVDGNTDKLTANQRAIILNAIALDEKLNPAMNDFAETSGGLANQTRMMKAQWQDMLVTLGQNLLPIALKVVTALNGLLEKFNALTPVQQKIVLGFLGFLAILGPLLSGIGTLISVASTISGALGGLSTMGISLAGIGTTITAVMVPAIAAVGAALLPILVVIASIIFFVGLLAFIWKSNMFFIRDAAMMAGSVIKSVWKALLAFLRGDTDAALEYLKEAWTTFMAHVTSVFSKFEGLRAAFQNFLNWLQKMMSGFVSYISNAISKVNWSQLGKYILFGIANGMLLGIPCLILAAGRAAEAALATIKNKLGIHSRSTAFEALGMYSGQGYQYGLARSMNPDEIARTMTRPMNQLSNSQQQNITMQFASGLTIQQVQGMIAANSESLVERLNRAIGG